MDPRSNSLADLLRRTAARDGAKVALDRGRPAADLRRARRGGQPRRQRAGATAACGRATASRCCRATAASTSSWSSRPRSSGAVLVPVNFMLDAAPTSRSCWTTARPSALVAGEALADVAEEALERAAAAARVAVRVALGPAPAGWEPYAALAAHDGRVRSGGAGGRRRPRRSSCTRAAPSRGRRARS